MKRNNFFIILSIILLAFIIIYFNDDYNKREKSTYKVAYFTIANIDKYVKQTRTRHYVYSYRFNEITYRGEDKSTVRISVAGTMDGSKRSKSGLARTFSHEAGHTAGLRHTHDPANKISDVNQNTPGVKNKTLKNNLMNSDTSTSKVPSNTGTDLTNSQLKSVDETIRNQQ